MELTNQVQKTVGAKALDKPTPIKDDARAIFHDVEKMMLCIALRNVSVLGLHQ